MIEPKSVLVLCTGNSCRSQMTAAYLRALAGDRLKVASAGTEPADQVHPLTTRVLTEDGLERVTTPPADYRRFVGLPLDHLIVVCDGAARACPSGWPGVGETLSWTFDDPAAFEGPQEEVLVEFRRVRDEIKKRVSDWLKTL